MSMTGYSPGNSPGAGVPAQADGQPEVANLERLRSDYLSYLNGKSDEIKEQKDARRYYHSSQWSAKAVKEFDRRKQPVVTYNREARKINAVIGLLERQRQDPRAYPRTPQQEEGAEIATATIRYVVDEQRWKEKSPIAALNGAVDGIGGIELTLEQGDHGDPEIGLAVVDPSSYFYDARSLQPDFDDARFQGVGKWADIDAVIELAPEKEAEIRAAADTRGSDLTSNPDSDNKWVSGEKTNRKLRLVDHWYIKGGEWYWCIYTGDVELMSGPSYLKDEKGKTICKYIMFSANVDQDGDRYGFHRGMKSAQDEINQRRSKGLHTLNSRRVIVTKGAVDDIENLRQEAVRPDGVIIKNPGEQNTVEFDDAQRQAEVQGQLEFLQDAKNEIDNYGFNPSLVGTGVSDLSGRAIQLQQQAGIAELGPYLLAWKGWKLRVYRAIWCAIQQWWTAERWIRVTDDQDLAQFFAVNQLGVDPRTGAPAIVNKLGALDVDIIIDEGPDEINMQADAYDTLSIMAQKGAQVPPELLIELSPLTGSVKKKALDILEKAGQDPAKQAAVQLEMQGKQADNAKKMADARLSIARAASEGQQQPNGADPAQIAFDKWKALLEAFTSIKVAEIGAGQSADAAAIDAHIDAFLGVTGLANDQVMQLRDHAHQQAMARLNPPQPAAQAA